MLGHFCRLHRWSPWSLVLLVLAGCERVEVTTVDVAQVQVTPQAASVHVNATVTLTASVLSSSGTPLSGRPVAWSSLDPAIAEVSQSGTVRGLAPGSARIQASSEGVTGTGMVTVTARQPVVAVEPQSLAFTAPQGGGNPPSRAVDVTETEGGELTGLSAEVAYPVGQPAGWVVAELNASSAPAVLTVGVVTGPLTTGTYEATVRIIAPGASNTPQSVQIEFVVEPALPAIALSRPNATFAGLPGGSNPAPVQIEITNAGAGSVAGLARSITYGAGQPGGWLTATLAGTAAPTTLTLSAALGSLSSGTHTATVRLTSTTAVNSPVDIPVTLSVAEVAPDAPSNLVANAVSASQIDLSWSASTGGAVERYRIERRTGASGSFVAVDSVGGGTLSYQSTGLSPATQYTYRVQACNAVGCSDHSNQASATTAQVPPGAPSGLQANAVSASRIDLGWSPSSGTVEWYRIERRTGAAAFAVIDSVAGGTSSYQDTGLSPATQYDYRVRACNVAGCSDYTNQASATTAEVAPGAPSGLQANAVSASRIDLAWSASTGTVDRYRIERRTGADAFAVIDSVAGGTLSYEDTGLSPATQYDYRVRACNVAGCSIFSNTASATTAQVAPGPPADLEASAVSPSQIDLAWSASSGVVDWYRIERRTGADAFAVIDSVAGGTLSYEDTGLSSATQYDYRVRACNVAGCSAFSNTASATTAQVAPGAPSGLAANAVSASRIDLSWSASSGTVEWYRIERRTGAAAFAVIDSVAGGTLSFQNTGLTSETQYDYRVQACNVAGCSVYSNEASATTALAVPGAPSGLTANAVSSSQIDLAWSASSGTVDRYRIERRTGSSGPFAVIDSVAGGTLSYQNTGLTPETLYTYRVRACNAAGCSDTSNQAPATTTQATPGAPSNLDADVVSESQIDLSWSASSGTVDWYRIERRTGGAAFAVIDSVAGGTLAFADTGLAPATAYDYRVRACNDAGCSDYSNEASATTDPVAPGAPSNLDADAVSESQVDLSWSASSGTVDWYHIERRSGVEAFAGIDSVAGGVLVFEDSGLTPATQYDYRVQACNDAGCSDYSNEASATTDEAPEPDSGAVSSLNGPASFAAVSAPTRATGSS